MSDDALRHLDALLRVALRLARTAPSGRIALAKLASQLDPAWLPGPGGARFWTQLQAAERAAVEPLPLRTVETVLRAAWDAAPTDELDDLAPEPVAATPTSQVHRGTLDGAPVAVKILRPGLTAAVRQDLTLLESLAGPLRAALPAIDPAAVLREVRERVLDELDLEHEAGMQRRVQRALRHHAELFVPAPVMRLSHETVLVSQWVDGTPLDALTDPTERDTAAARLAAFVLGGLRAGIVHSDADPADVLLAGDGRLAVLDFGSALQVPSERADHALALVEAFARADGDGLGAALDALGFLAPDHGETALRLAGYALGELGEEPPSRLDSAALIAAADRIGDRPGDAATLLLAARLPPDQVWPLRGIAQLFGTIARVGATHPWREVILRALREGWNGTG